MQYNAAMWPVFPRKLKVVLIMISLGLASLGIVIWVYGSIPLTSPLTENPRFEFLHEMLPSHPTDKVVYGYVPYWNLDKMTLQPELTHLAYFGLTLGADGSFLTQTEEGGEPGFAKLKSETWLDLTQQAKANSTSTEIVLAQFNNDDIVALLSSPAAHQRLLQSLDALLLAYPVNGINIDIEYSGEITPALRQRMTELVTTIRQHLTTRYSGVKLSMAMYASAADSSHLWDVPALQTQLDYIVIMAYDFHRRSSPLAGPVAPLFGGKELWDSDISQHLQEFLAVVPPEKLLLGVPFYGYEWQATDRDPQAHTFPGTGATASFKRVQELLAKKDELQVAEGWNETALSPYISYEEDGEIYVVYYENSRSLSYKLDYVNQLDLAGIAIWALGYEGNNRELWDVIERKL